MREVLYDTEKLNTAVTELVDANEITKGNGKRDFVLKTTKQPANQAADQSSDSDPDGEDETASGGNVLPAAAPAKTPKPKDK